MLMAKIVEHVVEIGKLNADLRTEYSSRHRNFIALSCRSTAYVKRTQLLFKNYIGEFLGKLQTYDVAASDI